MRHKQTNRRADTCRCFFFCFFKKDLPLTELRQRRRVNVVRVAVITFPGRFIFVYPHFVCSSKLPIYAALKCCRKYVGDPGWTVED